MVSNAGAFELGGVSVGRGRCFVIAEAGVNHNGDLSIAHRLIDIAADAGADAVKFQTFIPEQLVSPGTPKAEYQIVQTGSDEDQLEMLRRFVLPLEAYQQLAAHAAERRLVFLSTPFDAQSADLVESLGVPAFKIPSGEITNFPFLSYLARKGKPLLVSTGMSSLPEVAAAVGFLRKEGATALALFHCVSSYPAPAWECNLEAMRTMRLAFGLPVGWSDHTVGTLISSAAVAAGAELIEKHFTLDRTLPGPDHSSSLEPSELRQLVEATRTIDEALGTGEKALVSSEHGNIQLVRRSLYLQRSVAAGDQLQPADLIALRPAHGISPARIHEVVGRTARVPLAAGTLLDETSLS